MSALSTDTVIGVIGAGTMGAGIAQVAATAGHPVLLFDAVEGAAAKGIERTRSGMQRLVERGRMSAEQVDAICARITPVDTTAGLAPAGLVIEAIVEDINIKQTVFGEIETICGEDVILATNTSSISVTAIGAGLRRPERLVGMHFFNPAPILRLVEVISGIATDRAVAETVHATAAAWGKHPVHARSTPGFIVNRVARPFYAEALRVLEEGGADVATIDAALKGSGGFRMGPFELMDLIGQDVNFAVTNSVFNAYYQDPRFLPSLLQREYVEGGLLGRKSGRGFYDYREGADNPVPAAAPAAPRPERVVVEGDMGVAEPLVEAIEAAGIAVERQDGEDGYLHVGPTTLALTDGRLATERAFEEDLEELVVFDLALDFADAARAVIAAADQTPAAGVERAAGLFQALGREVSVIDDVPGLIVMRTVCMLANEGADAVNQGVCDAAGCDTAMKGGVNYPRGPLAWAEAIGLPEVCQVLDSLAVVYGLDRYRVSPLLWRKVYAGAGFHE
ncbi:3-hydroxyadipyl-CoA dehydrogenase [wastewater metagenome]|uniref:3-hydroxyadipyl-CoA dehydrogenase n=2 Tax=unclassified sequences TaxID=12908 RepID=A0A5B8R8P2_9ZZZZ|nr:MULTISPECIES: 3-hydroxyacyl-CoA dehydrogenase PaaH [Arhodomonas]MCS4502703.1 3-hydroxyacyl-CoA dehydrogenase PaaC [Arhodomonas aquaeolei]QEA03814.1 3-hydroxyadipyl-CoA dehydrogenase [uncultured organism]